MDQIPSGKYAHFKGGRYRVLSMALHTETEQDLVIYMGYEGKGAGGVFARPLSSWVEVVKWPDGSMRPRFIPEEEADIRHSISTNLAE